MDVFLLYLERGGGKLTKLTLKQKKFADEYIISGNKAEAARRAGYSERTARTIGHKLLTKVDIQRYIQERTQELFSERSMSVAEALAISASIARGDVQIGYSKQVDKLTNVVTKEVSYEYTPSLEDRQRSLDHIFKVNGAYLDRQQIEHMGAVQFIDDIGEDDEN